MKKRPEDAVGGEILGQSYTPPGRSGSFDVPSYDDIADLTVLFKRFANTAASYHEAGGTGVYVNKEADFTITDSDLSRTYVCTSDGLIMVTLPDPASLNEGAWFGLLQAGTGGVTVVGDPIEGVSTISAQFQGMRVAVHDDTWLCVPQSGVGGAVPPLEYNEDHKLTVHTASSNQVGLRNITVSTSAPTGGQDGDIWLVY